MTRHQGEQVDRKLKKLMKFITNGYKSKNEKQ